MTVVLEKLIDRVRDNFSDISDSLIDTFAIKHNLEKARDYIGQICDIDDVTDTYLEHAYVALATYYSYITYTGMTDKRLGTMPEMSVVKLKYLNAVAVAFLKPISSYNINDDLTIDDGEVNKRTISYFDVGATALEENDL